MNYFFHILVMIEIYIILSLALNILLGYTGLFSVAQAAFYGIGAYIYALLLLKTGIPWIICSIISITLTSIFAWIIAHPFVKLKGDYFILGTLGLQIIVFDFLYNSISITRGPYGLPGIPRFSFFGFELSATYQNFILITIICSIVILFLYLILNSPFGRALKCIREDELAAQSIGKNTFKLKKLAFALSGGISAIAGVIYASYITYIDPTSFNISESIFIIAVLLLGGSGNIKGSIIGSIFMIVLPEILRFLGLPSSVAANMRQIIYATVLIIIIFLRPQGLMGEYKLE